ncbi:MAG TPA: trigger factor [Patescibacteria group bacterium]|nr:trigger factor [Patescibacteria group bacterium]
MKITAEKFDNHKVMLQVEVPAVEVDKAVEKAYKKLAAQVSVPGFRKGKAPRKVLEMRVGKEALMDEAFEIMAPVAYAKALEEQKIEPVSRPQIDVVTLEEGQPLVFKATVVVKPEVTLGQYKGVKVVKTVDVVTDETVAEDLSKLQERHSKMVVVEDAELATGDLAVIDFKGFIDGVPFDGGEGKSYPLEIGSGNFIPGFEEQLIGAKPGEERDVQVNFPDEYHAAALAGKPATFSVKIHDIKRKEVPEIDDEFAREVSEFDTLADLKADRKAKLEEAAAQKAERDFRTAAVKAVVEGIELEVPDEMVETQIDTMIGDLEASMESRGMKLDKYLEYTRTDRSALRTNYREAALFNVKTELVMEAIVKAENLEATAEDMEAEINMMAEAYGTTPEEVDKVIRSTGRLSMLTDSVLQKKATQLVLDNVVQE